MQINNQKATNMTGDVWSTRVLTECRVFKDANITTYSFAAIKILLFHEYKLHNVTFSFIFTAELIIHANFFFV